jgi:hypothetical protein
MFGLEEIAILAYSLLRITTPFLPWCFVRGRANHAHYSGPAQGAQLPSAHPVPTQNDNAQYQGSSYAGDSTRHRQNRY